MTITIMLADDHEVVRKGLQMTIEPESDMSLLAAVSNGAELLARLAEQPADVVLLDVQMPVMDGLTAARQISERYPQTQILMLTSFASDAQLHAALQAGVTGYLLKDASGDALLAAIRGAAQGEPQLHPEIARRLMQQMPQPTTPLDALTDREREVLVLIATGLSNKEIGAALTLSETTIKGYVSTILGKLYVADRTQAALLAVRYGLVKLDELPDSPAQ